MSAYNRYLAEFDKLDDEIAQQHSVRQLALESFAKFKKMILAQQPLLANFNGVINELKLVTQYDDIADLENSCSALNELNTNLLVTEGKIKTPEIKEQFDAFVNFCRNEMTLAEIDNSLAHLKIIQENNKQAESKIRAELKQQKELKRQADELKREQEEAERQANILKRKREEAERNRQEELKRRQEEAERKHQEELEYQSEKNRKREKFKSIGVKQDGLIVNANVAFDSNTDLMWMTTPLVVQRLQQDGKTPHEERLFIFSEIPGEIDAFNQRGGCADYTDWKLPTAEEFETLQNFTNNYYNTKVVAYINESKKFSTKFLKIDLIITVVIFIFCFLYQYNYFDDDLTAYLFKSAVASVIVFAVFGWLVELFEPKKGFGEIVPILTGNEYWTNSPSADEQHGQVCCRFEDKIIKRNKLKSEKHHVTLVRKF